MNPTSSCLKEVLMNNGRGGMALVDVKLSEKHSHRFQLINYSKLESAISIHKYKCLRTGIIVVFGNIEDQRFKAISLWITHHLFFSFSRFSNVTIKKLFMKLRLKSIVLNLNFKIQN